MSKVTWTISNGNSRIYIKLKWLRISRLAGHFTRISGEVHADRFFANPEVYLLIEAGSLDTQNPEQNDRLKGQKMLDADKYPFLEFSSVEGCRLRSGSIWELTGVMTIKESTYPLTMIINKSDIDLNTKRNVARFRLFGELNLENSNANCNADSDYGRAVAIEAEIFLTLRE
jgi:polyisoprenoid-binding protein YceI